MYDPSLSSLLLVIVITVIIIDLIIIVNQVSSVDLMSQSVDSSLLRENLNLERNGQAGTPSHTARPRTLFYSNRSVDDDSDDAHDDDGEEDDNGEV